LFNWKRFRSS